MITNVQALRFFAALGVAVLHCGILNGVLPGFVLGGVGVDVFFVISGFIMVVSSWREFGKKGAGFRFIRRRLIRIVPLYWILTAAFVGWNWWQGGFTFNPPTPGVFPQIIFGALLIPVYMAPYFAVGWTLNFEMFFYALFALAIRLPKFVAIGLVALTLYMLTRVGSWVGVSPNYGFARYWLGGELLEFIWGMAIGALYCLDIKIKPAIGVVVSVFGLVLLVYVGSDPAHGSRETWIGFSAAILLLGLVYAPQIPSSSRWGQFLLLLGNSSYALYLFHWVLFYNFHALPQPVLVLIAVVVSIGIYVFIEAPLLRLMRGRRVLKIAVVPVPA